MKPSKSFWSFDSKGLSKNDDYDEDGEKMKKDLAFAAPGSVLNETKKERIARLKADNWMTVGLRNPIRGWKGSEYYENFCNEVLTIWMPPFGACTKGSGHGVGFGH
jgi:hypothetical protein